MTCHIRYATKKQYLVDNLQCHYGKYKWDKYCNIPIDYLEQELYKGTYDNKKRETTTRERNIRIKEYIIKRIKEEKEKKEKDLNIGFISFE